MSLAQMYNKELLLEQLRHADELQTKEDAAALKKWEADIKAWRATCIQGYTAAVKRYMPRIPTSTWDRGEPFKFKQQDPPARPMPNTQNCSLINKSIARLNCISADKNGNIRLSGDDPAIQFIRCK